DPIGVCSNTVYAIELIIFTGHKEANKNVLQWSTASETNNDYFLLERTQDMMQFELIEKVYGAGNSNTLLNYEVYDFNPPATINYYRLKSADFDGNIETYNFVVIDNTEVDKMSVNIYPNPAYNEIQCLINIPENTKLTIKIIDMLGRNLLTQTHPIEKGTNIINLDVSDISTGIYNLQISSSSGFYDIKNIVILK
ncbi:MAG: T9SS type A sorting domain-containing protein, partial [Bacteroidetes bacterium]|nr:T9SS type A sorting domain-containing protein [Bacteroidota bacterium]